MKGAKAMKSRKCWIISASVASVLVVVIVLAAVLGTRDGDSNSSSLDATLSKTHYIAADVVWWDYAPLGLNQCKGEPFDEVTGLYTKQGIGSKYKKVVFQEYTDKTFKVKTKRSDADEHLGLLGPTIYAEVGNKIQVVLRNNANMSVNFLAAGMVYDAATPSEPISFNQTINYIFTVPPEAGPSPTELSSKLWLYRSSADEVANSIVGLVGALIVTRAGGANSDGRAKDVDRDIITFYQVMDENRSPLLNATMTELKLDTYAGLSAADFVESNEMHGINGFVYCNIPKLGGKMNERIRWHSAVEGGTKDLHSAHWHGNVLQRNGMYSDSYQLRPGSTISADLVADNPGVWLLHCHVNDHLKAGMQALYTLSQPSGGSPPNMPPVAKPEVTGVVRQYYIAAVEQLWDYAPLGGDACEGSLAEPAPFGDGAKVFLEAGPERIGSRYLKARFVEFTDGTFTSEKVRTADEEHLALMGPIIRGEVGDQININFLNNCSRSVSVHAHGVFYYKGHEGSPYNDGTSAQDHLDDAISPGGNYTYEWFAVPRSGPLPGQGSSIMWMYHSHTDEIADTYAGLFGAIIITRKGSANPDGSPIDVDREMVLHFMVNNEASSFYFLDNMQRFLPDIAANETALAALSDDGDFQESNLMHAMNGRLFCNLEGLTAIQGRRTRFHVMALGTEVDLHTPNAFSTSFIYEGTNAASLQLMPGGMHSADAVLNSAGSWLLQCRVADHVTAGMRGILTVSSNGTDAFALPSSTGGTVRTFYIAAVERVWNYAPSARDLCSSDQYAPADHPHIGEGELALGEGEEDANAEAIKIQGLGLNYTKALYRQFTDATFTKDSPIDKWNGVLGPTIHLEVGDTLVVVFKNSLSFPANFFSGGGLISSNSSFSTAPVAPGETATYTWKVPVEAGPGPKDTSTVAFMYSSTVDLTGHLSAGLVGAIVIARPGGFANGKLGGPAVLPSKTGANKTLVPTIEIPLLFGIVEESASPLAKLNVNLTGRASEIDIESQSFLDANRQFAINGYIYCNLPEISVVEGTVVRFILMSWGSEQDVENPAFPGQSLAVGGASSYGVEVSPAMVVVADMLAESPGYWMFNSRVTEHILGGMTGRLTVTSANRAPINNFWDLWTSASTTRKLKESTQVEEGGPGLRRRRRHSRKQA